MNPFLKSNFLYLISFILLMGLTNCKKKPKNLGFISLGEAKDYLYFKSGTWWIYKNSYTNEIDSMALLSCHLDTFHAESDKRFFDYEDIVFHIKSYRDNASYYTHSRGMVADVLDFRPGWRWECQRDGGYYSNYWNGSGLSSQFFYPFDKNSGSGNGDYETKFLERKDSIIVKGKTYYDIVSFSVYHDGSYPYPNIYIGQDCNNIYYWAKNFGIVKIEMQGWDINNKVILMNWELIESHINK